ncbi:uncharacterized protein LOC135132345 isoform X2 [Zophobas morio]
MKPEIDNAKTTVCEEDDGATIPPTYLKKLINDIDKTDIETRVSNRSELKFECFTMVYEAEKKGQSSGVYRGCVEKTKYIESSCTYIEEWLNKNNVSSCTTCSDDKCNNEYVGGAAALTMSLGILTLNLLLCVKVFTF